MYNLLHFIVINLDLVGIILLVGSLPYTIKLINEVEGKALQRLWIALNILVFVFIVTYSYVALEYRQKEIEIDRYTICILLFFGALFVFLVAKLSLKTALDIKQVDLLEKEIANRKDTEIQLKQERDFSTELIENAQVIIVMLDNEGKIVFFNNYIETLTGYSMDEVKGKDWFDTFIPEPLLEKIKSVFIQASNGKQTNGTVNPILTKKGTQRVIEWHNKILKDAKGNTTELLSVGLDITERKEMEKELHESEEKFRALVESTSDWIWEVDSNGRYTYSSPNVEVLLGYKPQEIIGKSPFDIMPAEEAKRVGNIFIELTKKCAPLSAIKNTCICKDGSLKIMETSGVPFFNENGEFLGYRGIDRDITEREHDEKNLYESEEKLRSITGSAQDAIIMMNNEGKIIFWNEAAEKIFGYTEEEVMDKMLHQFIAPSRFLAAHNIGFEHFKKTGEGPVVGKTIELVALKKDGMELPIELSLSATMIDGLWNAIGIIRDITQRKEMESELNLKEELIIVQSRQAAMGEMISMIAHQWRQPITVVAMMANNIKLDIALGETITNEELENISDDILYQTKHLSKTIDDFRNFFHPSQKRTKTTLGKVLDDTIGIIGKSLENNNIKVKIDNKSNKEIETYPNQLLQVLLNLINNAKDALQESEQKDAKINITIKESDTEVTICVCDNGGGVPKEILPRLGEPYISSKAKSGTGLGVYMSMIVVEKHLGGTLTWENRDGGACFVITLI